MDIGNYFAHSASLPLCPRVKALVDRGIPVNPNAVYRDHPQAYAPLVFNAGAYRPRVNCDDGAFLLTGEEREAYEITLAAAQASPQQVSIKQFHDLGVMVTVNLQAPAIWRIARGEQPLAGGEVAPAGAPQQLPPNFPVQLPREVVDVQHGTQVHHHYLPPEHRHHGGPTAQNVIAAVAKLMWRR